MKHYLLLITLFFFACLVNAQTTSVITGRILDSENLPLPGANVTVEGTDIGTVSDVNGFYTLVQVPSGSHQVHVSYIGFNEETKEVVVSVGKTAELNINLKPGIMLNEVEISYHLQGQAKALNQQKSSDNVTNIVASDQVGKFPDANIGDALKRIPGINVQYDQGEARFGHVRGTEPRLNSVSINGERIPSAEAEIRSVQLDLIPSDMIQTIEVSKTLTADMDADAIGGSINLVTRSVPSGKRVSATLGSGYNLISGKPTLTGSVILGTRLADNKLGVVVSGSYYNNPLGSDNIEGEWALDDNGNAYLTNYEVRAYEVQRIRQSYSMALDYKFNDNHMIEVSGIYNHRNDFENRFRLRYKDIEQDDEGNWIAEIRRQTKAGGDNDKNARLEDQRTQQGKIKGEHLFGNVKFKWSGSYAKASEDRPQERYISYRQKDVQLIPNLSNTNKPSFSVVDGENADLNSNWGLHELTEENQYTDEIDMTAKLSLDIPLMTGHYKNSLSFGGKFRGKDKKRDNDFYEYEPIDEDAFNALAFAQVIDKTKSDFLAGNYRVGQFISDEFLGTAALNDPNQFDKSLVQAELVGNFNATENVTAAYVMFKQNFGTKFKAIAGVRLEATSLESQGYQYNDEVDEITKTTIEKNNYTNVLPNLQLKYELSKNQILRFAFTNTLARPDYYKLVPFKEIYVEDNEIVVGNPALTPTTSLNVDLMYENYFKSVGILSAGVFSKGIKDFIIQTTYRDYTYEGNTWDKFEKTINGGDATILGAELAFQRQLDFLPGALNGLGIYANYTFIHSKVTNFEFEGRENEDLALPGTPKNNMNASLSWDYKGFNIRVSGNWASSFRDSDGVGETAFYDRWYDKVFYLDVNSYYSFAKHWKIFVDASNLTNQPLRYYQGDSDRMMQAEYYNARISAGVKFDLNVE